MAHPAGQADAEWARRELKRTAARGVPKRELVPEPVRRTAKGRSVAQGVQRGGAAQQPELSHASRVHGADRGREYVARSWGQIKPR